MTKPIKITHYESGTAYENHPTKTMAGVEGGATDMNKHTEVEEIFGKECDTYEKDCPTCVVYKALTEARQAGIDEAVEIVQSVKIESQNRHTDDKTEDQRDYLNDWILPVIKKEIIKALQDNK
jgi:hypothetical protein